MPEVLAPGTDVASTLAPPNCHYFASGVCRSCTFIETPIAQQLATKQARCAELLPGVPSEAWLPAVPGGVVDFRNRAKLAVGGSAGAVTLGILDRGGIGVDLTDCLIHEPGIRDIIPALAEFLNRTGLAPYSVPKRKGELKYAHVTISPDGELMIRFVVRTEHGLQVLRSRTEELRELFPQAAILSVNLLPEHKAVLEGEREEPLVGSALAMRLGGHGRGTANAGREVTLYLRPQSFFQTNTSVALALYRQASEWVDRVDPRSVWDLYCGVGGFALFTARPAFAEPRETHEGAARSDDPLGASTAPGQRDVLGVEMSEQAIVSAERSASEAGIRARFLSGDATAFALGASEEELPEFVIVNPPRRGVGESLSTWLEGSPIRHVLYSSCNPESLARDLARMPSFVVREARLFDMFPHTGHLEVAVLLERTV